MKYKGVTHFEPAYVIKNKDTFLLSKKHLWKTQTCYMSNEGPELIIRGKFSQTVSRPRLT